MNLVFATTIMLAVSFSSIDPVPKTDPTDVEKLDLTKPAAMIRNQLERHRWSRLIDQMLRANQLGQLALRIDPWIHSTGNDQLLDDFEDAREAVEYAESLLRAELISHNTSSGSAEFGYRSDLLEAAIVELNDAEFTLEMLMAIAKNEN